ncbi:MAG TPA: ornithine cyclodeaminase family protein [Gemmatimonadaceae bacterium]|nr:ornithine cyclodeaminase family protein [Gemmatimonadaceae bacterium]
MTRTDVQTLLDPGSCIAAVERAFVAEVLGQTLPAGVLGTQAAGGGFHVKTAGVLGEGQYFAAKVNANFPSNSAHHGLPTIQGVMSLHDARTGVVLALLDSPSITALRTGAATAVAARHLAPDDARVVAIAGCGVQARSQLRALAHVRSLTRVYAHDVDAGAAARFADEMRATLACEIEPVQAFAAKARMSDIVVTCTPTREAFLSVGDVRPGAFVAAVGADSNDKQELDPALLSTSTLVVDDTAQCATIGELHHALAAGLMTRDDVHATLAEIVAGRRPGRTGEREIIVFDSTGTGLEDVAAASMVYERALAVGAGMELRLDA